VAELVRALKDPQSKVRARAAADLGNLEHPATSAIAPLRALLVDEEEDVRWSAVGALVQYGSLALPALKEGLKADQFMMRERCAFVLGELGAEAESAVPDLIAALKDKDSIVRCQVAAVLAVIGHKSSVPALTAALKNEKVSSVRSCLLEALGTLGVKAVSQGNRILAYKENR
jgi:HEAT repeat protein